MTITYTSSWTVHPTPLPQGLNDSVSGPVTIVTSMGCLTARSTRKERFRRWVYKHRSALTCGVSVVSGLLVLPVVGVLGSVATLASAAACVQISSRGTPLDTAPTERHEAVVAEVCQVEHMVMVDGRAIRPTGDSFCTPVVQEWVHKLQLHFGGLQDTAADRRVARMWLADEMKTADMRNKDAVRLIPVVIELAFLPQLGDIIAKSLAATKTAAMLKAICPTTKP
nr:hypothetical protein [Tolivirales sp.]